MFKKILVGIDGSEVSKSAFRIAIDEAKAWNVDINVIYVIETGMLSSIPADNTLEAIYSLLETEGKNTIDECQKLAGEAGIKVIPHIRQGHAGNEIIETAEEIDADLIILGSHGKSELDRILLGSVTGHVVRHSGITTMVVRS
ncbi:MAG: universal stress protein [Methanogenium sp.]|nr:universal stress protein [Methanogenium sp.]